MTHSVCVSENLIVGDDGQLRMAPWCVPRLLADVVAGSPNDGPLWQLTTLPGKLLIDVPTHWRNDTPVDHMVIIRVTRGTRSWLTSNPNAIQFRDRWSWVIDGEPAEPITSGLSNGQAGSAGDTGTNTVAEPNPGRFWHWQGTGSVDEVVGPIEPGSRLDIWYRCYVWTPPPFSGNANKNSPNHSASAWFSRIQLIGLPEQGALVSG